RLRRGRETRLLPLLSGLRRHRLLHHGDLAWSCGRPGGRVRGSFLPCADEVGLGGAATFVAAASRRHRTRELIGGSGKTPERLTPTGCGFGDLEAYEHVASRDVWCCDLQVWQVLGQPSGGSAT